MAIFTPIIPVYVDDHVFYAGKSEGTYSFFRNARKFKGYTQEKIPHLLDIDIFFSTNLEIQENYTRGKVSCLIAACEGKFTLGFKGGSDALNPITLFN